MLLAILWGDLLWWECVCCLNRKFCILWPDQWWSCWKDILEFLSSVEGKLELLLFLCSKVHIEQCISLYLCSCLCSSTVILLSNMCMYLLGVLGYHVLPLILCISIPLGSQEPRIFGVSLWHICKAVLLHVWRDWPYTLVPFHFTVISKYIYKNGSIFCICRSVSNLSAVKDFGIVLCVPVTSCATASVCGVVSSGELCWAILHPVLNAGPSEWVVDSMLIVAGLF